MGRLKAMRPRLQTAAPRRLAVNSTQDSEAKRDKAAPWRRWYKTARWQALRWQALIADDFTCRLCRWEHPLAMQCRELKALGRADLMSGRAPDLVADHIEPHRGATELFWDPGNLQCLCKPCHDKHKQRAEALARRGGGG
ncbi:HNH endonuclease [Cereibacter sphaeroides]|nr:HNH endonuclease [Cereibacter sphaeroides]